MKITVIILFFTLLSNPDSLTGVWVYKQDCSRIEFKNLNGKLSGKILSTKNSFNEAGMEIFKDFTYLDGKWHGQYYLISKDRWVKATMEPIDKLIFIELDLGYKIKRIHLYKEK